jgi:tetrapyrrole methylase family protein/MazG family protein
MEDREKIVAEEFVKLYEAIKMLRSPEGCPWDREQTHESLKQYAIEETYELIEAIESSNMDKVEDELGDVMLQVLLHSEIASESELFDVADVCRRHREKLQRRHPHVFSDVEVDGIDEIWKNWETIKRAEKGNEHRKSALDGVPDHLPALMKANKIGKKAARHGFDWPDILPVLDKLQEEAIELREAMESEDSDKIKEEIGDLLFSVVNIARHVDVDPEEALRQTTDKFRRRFIQIEEYALSQGRELRDMTLQEMDAIWDEVKLKENT